MPLRPTARSALQTRLRTLLVLVVVAAWAVAGGSVASDPVASDPAGSAPVALVAGPRIRAGAEAFVAHGCAACHRLDAVGATGLFGPVLNEVGRVAAERVASPGYRGEAIDAEGYLRESIVDPAAYLVPGYAGSYHRMPAYAHLSDEELASLIALLLGTAPEGRSGVR